jgi:hypothetical protein
VTVELLDDVAPGKQGDDSEGGGKAHAKVLRSRDASTLLAAT